MERITNKNKQHGTLGTDLEIGPGCCPFFMEESRGSEPPIMLPVQFNSYTGIEPDSQFHDHPNCSETPNIGYYTLITKLAYEQYSTRASEPSNFDIVKFQEAYASTAAHTFDTLVMRHPIIESWNDCIITHLLEIIQAEPSLFARYIRAGILDIITEYIQNKDWQTNLNRTQITRWQENLKKIINEVSKDATLDKTHTISKILGLINKFMALEKQSADIIKFMHKRMLQQCRYNGSIHITTFHESENKITKKIIANITKETAYNCTIYLDDKPIYSQQNLSTQPNLQTGEMITITGLKNAQQHNGKTGQVEYQMASGRYSISNIEGISGKLFIKPANLSTKLTVNHSLFPGVESDQSTAPAPSPAPAPTSSQASTM